MNVQTVNIHSKNFYQCSEVDLLGICKQVFNFNGSLN